MLNALSLLTKNKLSVFNLSLNKLNFTTNSLNRYLVYKRIHFINKCVMAIMHHNYMSHRPNKNV